MDFGDILKATVRGDILSAEGAEKLATLKPCVGMTWRRWTVSGGVGKWVRRLRHDVNVVEGRDMLRRGVGRRMRSVTSVGA